MYSQGRQRGKGTRNIKRASNILCQRMGENEVSHSDATWESRQREESSAFAVADALAVASRKIAEQLEISPDKRTQDLLTTMSAGMYYQLIRFEDGE